VGFPASVKLNQWAFAVKKVFGGSVYHVGSSLTKKDARDVDVVCILDDEEFVKLFGSMHFGEWDWKWAGLCTAFSEWGRTSTGLNIDFKFQPVSFANEKHKGPRGALGKMIEPEWRKNQSADTSQ